MKHELCYRSGRQRYRASVTRCPVHPLMTIALSEKVRLPGFGPLAISPDG